MAGFGGWSVLSQPGQGQAYTNAVNKTARQPYGPKGPTFRPPPIQGHPLGAQPQPGAQPGAQSAPGAPPQPQSPPFDSTYYANVNANQFKTGNAINALNLQGAQNDTALQQALGQLAYQQPRDSLKLEQSFNNRGGLYSSVEGQGLGDLTHSYATRQTAAQTSHDATQRSLAARIAALQQGVPYYNAQQEAASASRLAALAANDPSLGQPTGGLQTGGAQPAPGGPAAPGPAPAAGGPANGVPRRITNFANRGGWSVLSHPGAGQAYTQAVNATARNPYGRLASAVGRRRY